jgi:hypothetical protein
MTELYLIYGDDGVTAVEIYCGDEVKYCEHFNSWQYVMNELKNFMGDYAAVRVVSTEMWNWFYSKSYWPYAESN